MTRRKRRRLCFAIAMFCILTMLLCILFCLRDKWKGKDDMPTITIADTLPDGNGKEAVVILLGGQSNASGASRVEYLQKNVAPQKYAQYESGFDNVYINYVSGQKKSNEFVKCAINQGEIDNGFGPELGIADKLNELYPDCTFFIIKCAFGGSNLYNQWLSPTSFGKTGEFYRVFVSFVNANLAYLKSKNYDIKIEAMCWMQGESDSYGEDNAREYARHLKNFIKDIRREFKDDASDDGIGFVDALIADNPKFWTYYEQVNACKREVYDLSPMNALVDTIALGLTCSEEPEGEPDLAHYDALSEIKLGHHFIIEARKFF